MVLKTFAETFPHVQHWYFLPAHRRGPFDTIEFRYLAGFQKFLEGTPLEEQFRIFDDALAVAPWNDSLRARIYLQYRYFASTRWDPAERARLMRKANDLNRDR